MSARIGRLWIYPSLLALAVSGGGCALLPTTGTTDPVEPWIEPDLEPVATPELTATPKPAEPLAPVTRSGFAESGNFASGSPDNSHVVAASGSQPLPPPQPLGQPMALPEGMLPMPMPVPAEEDFGPPIPGVPIGVQPIFIDPHRHAEPTVNGQRLDLRPHEVPVARMTQLTQSLDAERAENEKLLYRLKEIEALLAERDRALREGAGEMQRAGAEAETVAAEVRQLRERVDELRSHLRKLEREDVETLRGLVAALEKILGPNAGLSGLERP